MKLNEETEDKTTWEYGYVFLSDQEADNLNVSIQTIKKRHKTLQEKRISRYYRNRW